MPALSRREREKRCMCLQMEEISRWLKTMLAAGKPLRPHPLVAASC
jgi:hypothetical protein